MKNLKFAFIDALLLTQNGFYHSDFFAISTAQLTRTLGDYRSLFPEQIEYSHAKRRYIPKADFKGALIPGNTTNERKENAKKFRAIMNAFKGDFKMMQGAYLESLIISKGHFDITDLMETFGLSKPQITRDIAAYKKAHPKQVSHFGKTRGYEALIHFEAQTLSLLDDRYGKRSTKDKKAKLCIEDISFLRQIDEGTADTILNCV